MLQGDYLIYKGSRTNSDRTIAGRGRPMLGVAQEKINDNSLFI